MSKEKSMSNTTLIKTYIFAATRETVWSFLTEKEKLEKWFHPATADLKEGEDYALVKIHGDGTEVRQCWGTVLKMDKPNKLIYSFTVEGLKGALTTVIWELDEIPDGTKLTLRHEGIEEAAGDAAMGLLLGLDKGWDKHVDSLRDYFQSDFSSSCNKQ